MKTGFWDQVHSASVFKPALKRAGLFFLGLMAGLVVPARVGADGCFVAAPFVWNKAKDINEPTQKAILVHAAGQEDLILQVKYHGPVEKFGWLVPVPGRPAVRKGSMECFYELSRYTQEHWEPRAAASWDRGMNAPAPAGLEAGPKPEPVKVIEIKTVGAYEVAVLSASEPGSLEDWLAANGFAFPKDKAAVIDDYVKQHWYFAAIKIDLAKAGGFQLAGHATRAATAGGSRTAVAKKLSAGELQPLQLSFASDRCVFPLKISSVNGTPSEVQVYVLSPEPLLERGMFEKKFPALIQQARAEDAARMQRFQNRRDLAWPAGRRMPRQLMDTNLLLAMDHEMSVPYEALLKYAEVGERDFPACARMVPGFKGQKWWLTKQTWTFQPEEMRDLWFQPAAPALAEDLAGDAGFYAARSLEELGAKIVPVLSPALQHTNPRVRIYATHLLRGLDTVGATPDGQKVLAGLPALFQDPEPAVRGDAAYVAGANWNPKFAEPLLKLWREDNGWVRESAMSALATALQKHPSGTGKLLPVLHQLLKDPDPELQFGALEVLVAARAPLAPEEVRPLLASPDPRVVNLTLSELRRDGFSAEDLIPLLHNGSMQARLAGLRILREFGDKQAIEVVLPLLRDPEPLVQSQARELLATLSGQEIPQDQPDRWAQWWAANKNPVLIADHTRAIELDATNGEEYHVRGCLYYDARDFTKALADFRQACKWGSDYPDYPHYRVWLIRARSGEAAAATRELAAYLASRRTGQPGDWPSTVGRFLAGQLSEGDLLKAADNPNERTRREQLCEAWFYAGMKRLIAGETTAAAGDFQKCLGTGVTNFQEYASAGAELKSLPAGR
jgi:HEAT repeat protein